MTKRITSVILALIMIIGISPATAVCAADVKIVNNLSINVGETKPLGFTDPDGNPVNVIWESSNPDIATVTSDGKVTAKKAGTCIISCWWNSKLYGVNITVKGAAKQTKTTAAKTKKIALSAKTLSLTPKQKSTLKLKNAKAKKVKWTTSNKKVATVSKKGVVTAKKKGKATITAKYKGKKYTCKVTVSKKGITEQQAFNKVKNYLLKNGEKTDTGVSVFYEIRWSGNGMSYSLTYNAKADELVYQSFCFADKKLLMQNYLSFGTKNQAFTSFESYDTTNLSGYTYFNKTKYKSSLGLTYTNQRTGTSTDETERQANAFLQWTMPELDAKIKKIAKVNLKQLGLKNWDK